MQHRLLGSQIISCFGQFSSYFLNLAHLFRLLFSSRIVHNIYYFRYFMFSIYYDFIFSLMFFLGLLLKYINNYLMICLDCVFFFLNMSFFFFNFPSLILHSQGTVELIKHTGISHALGFPKFIRIDYIIQWISWNFCANYSY